MDIKGEENKNVDHEILHGVTLTTILDTLIEEIGFEELSYMIEINCFANNPSKQSSLKFLRKTEWARIQIQGIYVTHMLRKNNRRG